MITRCRPVYFTRVTKTGQRPITFFGPKIDYMPEKYPDALSRNLPTVEVAHRPALLGKQLR
jgi:hypothetical protein